MKQDWRALVTVTSRPQDSAPYINRQSVMHAYAHLLGSQHPRSSPLRRLLALLALVKGCCAHVVTANVVEILHLVDPDDPVLTSERLLHGRELRASGGQSHTTDTVNRLALLEEGVVVVVGHFVPCKISRRFPNLEG